MYFKILLIAKGPQMLISKIRRSALLHRNSIVKKRRKPSSSKRNFRVQSIDFKKVISKLLLYKITKRSVRSKRGDVQLLKVV